MHRSFFPLHRAEVEEDLEEGDIKLGRLMQRSRSFQPRETIIPAETSHGFVYRLRSGWCARVRYLGDGRAQIIAILLPGDLFGIRAMFLDRQPDEICAISAVVADQADQELLRLGAESEWQLSLRLNWQMLEDDRRLRNWTVALGCGHAEERMALFLLDLRGRLILSGAIREDAIAFPFLLTQQRAGDALGLTSVHVNRTVRRLRELGLATVTSGEARLHDINGLQRLAWPLLDIFEKTSPAFGTRAAASLEMAAV